MTCTYTGLVWPYELMVKSLLRGFSGISLHSLAKSVHKRPRLKQLLNCNSAISGPILMKFCMQKYFFAPGMHTLFHQGHKGYKAKGHKVTKAGGQHLSKQIFLAFYGSVSPLHRLLRYIIPIITEPMKIANCGVPWETLRIKPYSFQAT